MAEGVFDIIAWVMVGLPVGSVFWFWPCRKSDH